MQRACMQPCLRKCRPVGREAQAVSKTGYRILQCMIQLASIHLDMQISDTDTGNCPGSYLFPRVALTRLQGVDVLGDVIIVVHDWRHDVTPPVETHNSCALKWPLGGAAADLCS